MSYLQSAIDGCLDSLRNYSGSRNNELFRQATRLYTFAQAGVIGEGTITALLERDALSLGLQRQECRDTLRSAQRRARQAPYETLQDIREKCEGRRIQEGKIEPVYHPPETVEPPDTNWQGRLGDFVRYAQRNLDADVVFKNGLTPLSYLCARGFSEETIRSAGLGYNPKPIYLPRVQVGIPPEQDERGRWLSTIALPAGIVIPWTVQETLWRVSVRTSGDGGGKYRNIRGGANALYNADSLEKGKPAVIVEGVFDALAIQQEACDLISPVACGTTGARRVRWIGQIVRASQVLIGFDGDSAGQEATRYWCSILRDKAVPWRPLLKDAGEMLERGMSVRTWIAEGLGGEDVVGFVIETLSDGTYRLINEYTGEIIGVYDDFDAAQSAAYYYEGGDF